MLRFKCSHPLGVEVPTDTYVSQCLYRYICIRMLVDMYLQLYVLALKQPFKDHLPVVLECFHHLLSALLLLYSLWIFWRDSFFYVLRSRALDRGSALCSHHCCYSFSYIFFIFFSVFFFFLFSVFCFLL